MKTNNLFVENQNFILRCHNITKLFTRRVQYGNSTVIIEPTVYAGNISDRIFFSYFLNGRHNRVFITFFLLLLTKTFCVFISYVDRVVLGTVLSVNAYSKSTNVKISVDLNSNSLSKTLRSIRVAYV